MESCTEHLSYEEVRPTMIPNQKFVVTHRRKRLFLALLGHKHWQVTAGCCHCLFMTQLCCHRGGSRMGNVQFPGCLGESEPPPPTLQSTGGCRCRDRCRHSLRRSLQEVNQLFKVMIIHSSSWELWVPHASEMSNQAFPNTTSI